MAMALFRDLLDREGVSDSWRVESTGTWAQAGRPASELAQQVMQERGLDLSDHLSRPISGGLLREFDLILVMEAQQRKAIRIEFPDIADRVHLLAEIAGEHAEIEDPYGKSLDTYRGTANQLAVLLDRGFNKIVSLAE
jgi:protein-tyrosine-phosphatase